MSYDELEEIRKEIVQQLLLLREVRTKSNSQEVVEGINIRRRALRAVTIRVKQNRAVRGLV